MKINKQAKSQREVTNPATELIILRVARCQSLCTNELQGFVHVDVDVDRVYAIGAWP